MGGLFLAPSAVFRTSPWSSHNMKQIALYEVGDSLICLKFGFSFLPLPGLLILCIIFFCLASWHTADSYPDVTYDRTSFNQSI